MIEVVAKQIGYYDNRLIREGQTFAIKSEKEFSHKWMEKTEDVKKSQPMNKKNMKSVQDKVQEQDVL